MSIYDLDNLNKDFELLEGDLKLLNKKDFISSALLVGPEGGFSSNENIMLKKHKFIFPITLGKRILKSETAVVVGLSYLNFINSFYQINHQWNYLMKTYAK